MLSCDGGYAPPDGCHSKTSNRGCTSCAADAGGHLSCQPSEHRQGTCRPAIKITFKATIIMRGS